MTPKEANAIVVQALKDAQTATDDYVSAKLARDASLAHLTAAREVLEAVMRDAVGLDERESRREEYLRLYTFK
jgi:hypothetical protein